MARDFATAVARTCAPAREGLRRWGRQALDLVYPPECTHCRAPLETSATGLLCDECRQRLVARGPACPTCAATLVGPAQFAAAKCAHCQNRQLAFAAAVRLGHYEGLLRQAVLDGKQTRGRALMLALADLLVDAHGETLRAWAPEAVVPVPMHWTRRLRRGSNSAETLAERVARRLALPMAAHVISRVRRTAPQASLSMPRREKNVRGAFRANRHRDLPGARLLVVDDIMTSGATLHEIARMLRKAGARQVTIAVLARAPGVA